MKRRILAAVPLLTLLGGCEMVVLSPSGYVAAQQRDMLVDATLLMLLIIVPVMGLTAFFAWRYSAKRKADYDPNWHHSTSLELVIWAPLLIIICLGGMTWVGTHLLDPFRPLTHIVANGAPVPEDVKPLEIDVVALDWKWLFIYPEYGVATVNEAAAPVDRPINFRLTSSSVMNAFYVPALAGMIYAMPGMESQLHAVMNLPGEYDGLSSNYSGAGFSGMRFKFHGLDSADFDAWIAQTRASTDQLGRSEYLDLALPSENVPAKHFGGVDPELFRLIVNRCVEQGRMCIDEMMALDGHGGTGALGTLNTVPAEGRQASALGHAPFYVGAICTVADSIAEFGQDGIVLLKTPPAARGSAETL